MIVYDRAEYRLNESELKRLFKLPKRAVIKSLELEESQYPTRVSGAIVYVTVRSRYVEVKS